MVVMVNSPTRIYFSAEYSERVVGFSEQSDDRLKGRRKDEPPE
jgi:hypothetical protein